MGRLSMWVQSNNIRKLFPAVVRGRREESERCDPAGSEDGEGATSQGLWAALEAGEGKGVDLPKNLQE